jgi:hypothetical protein
MPSRLDGFRPYHELHDALNAALERLVSLGRSDEYSDKARKLLREPAPQ